MGVLYLALYVTALGTGGLKSSVSGFGSDQFDETNPEEKKQMTKFFSGFFFFISIGALLAVTMLVYIQDNVGRRWVYGICVVAILTGLGLFILGTSLYRFKKLDASPITQIAAVMVAAWRKRNCEFPSDPAAMLHVMDKAESLSKQRLPHTQQFRNSTFQ